MEELKQFILQFVQPNEDELTSFLQHVKEETIARGKTIIKAGTVCDKMFFIKKGLVKYIMLHENDKSKAMHIAMDHDLVADFFSFYSGLPSISSVETLTACELFYISKKDLSSLYDQYKVWERFGRMVAEAAMLEQIMEKLNFQTKTPEQRYTELIGKKPSLLQEVNLGITQETLSRIRARL
jgi:CRP-like cAMP-binding protein